MFFRACRRQSVVENMLDGARRNSPFYANFKQIETCVHWYVLYRRYSIIYMQSVFIVSYGRTGNKRLAIGAILAIIDMSLKRRQFCVHVFFFVSVLLPMATQRFGISVGVRDIVRTRSHKVNNCLIRSLLSARTKSRTE